MVVFIFHRVHHKPSRASHRKDNLNFVFTFMKDIEELPIVNISKSVVIVEHVTSHLKRKNFDERESPFVLEWAVIITYQIGLGFPDGHENGGRVK